MDSPQNAWAKRNREKMRKIQAAYRKRHPDRMVAMNATRSPYKRAWNRLKRYGITEADFMGMLFRQKNRCACCSDPIDISAQVDHCHTTDKVRGLLCVNCNWGLGNAHDSPSTLYQMAAYLELDRSKPVVYLIGSLRNQKVVHLGNEIRGSGVECVDNWAAAGERADDAWQEYSKARGRTYMEALNSREAKHTFHFDRAYLNLSDAVVLMFPAGKSAALEFGYAMGLGKRGYMLMEEETDRYDVMLQFAGSPLFHDRKALLDAIKEDLLGSSNSLKGVKERIVLYAEKPSRVKAGA